MRRNRIVAPDVGVASQGTRNIQCVVRMGLTDRVIGLFEMGIERVCGDDSDLITFSLDAVVSKRLLFVSPLELWNSR